MTTSGNFGHIRESGVLLLGWEDSNVKHQRNALLATSAISTIFTLGLSSIWVCSESEREIRIRDINRKHFKELPYSHCVRLDECGRTLFNDLFYSRVYVGKTIQYKREADPIRLEIQRDAERRGAEEEARKARDSSDNEDPPYEFTHYDTSIDFSDLPGW